MGVGLLLQSLSGFGYCLGMVTVIGMPTTLHLIILSSGELVRGSAPNCIQSLLITVGLGVMAVLGATASEWKVSTPDW